MSACPLARGSRIVVLVSIILVAPLRAQTVAAPPPTAVRAAESQPLPAPPLKRSVSRTVAAIIEGNDATAGVVRLTIGGSEVTAKIGEASVFARGGKAARPADFPAGEKVTARLTFRTDGQVNLSGLWDEASYAAYSRDRREIAAGTVAANAGGRIEVRRADGSVLSLRVTEKSQVRRAGAPAAASVFSIGAPVAVKPRALPSGDLMAWIIADTEKEVSATYTDGLVNWNGSLESVDAARGFLVLRRSDGVSRPLAVAPAARIRKAGQPIALKDLPPGASVEIHLLRGADPAGQRTADAVTVVTPKSPKIAAPK